LRKRIYAGFLDLKVAAILYVKKMIYEEVI
jgi:hypothetical protein